MSAAARINSDMIHRSGADALQQLLGAFFLAGGKLAVDQDIAHRARENRASRYRHSGGESRQQPHHVQCGGGLVGGKNTRADSW
jgi:hypothetical protein